MKAIITLLITGLFSLYAISQTPDHPRGIYVDKFISLYTDGNGLPQLDPNTSILGVDEFPSGNPDGIYEKEIELLNYCKENRITYLVLYDMRLLTNGVLASNNPPLYNYLKDRLCEFMTEAKNNYCINSFGAVAFKASSFQDIVNYNTNNAIPPFNLTIQEKNLLGNNQLLINVIESTTINPTDSTFYIQQLFRFGIGMYRYNSLTQGQCPDFDVLNMEYEFWNKTDDGDNITTIAAKWLQLRDVYLPGLKSIATGASMKSEIYLGYLYDDVTQTQKVIVADNIDGSNAIPNMDRILLHTYLHYPNLSFTNYANYRTRIDYFRQNTNKNATDVHPIFSAEELTYFHGDDDFFGKWFTEASQPPFLIATNPNYTHNLFSAERIYYNDWRNAATNYGNANLSSPEENIVKPGAAQWFASSFMVNQLEHPSIFYTNDAPRCTTSTISTIPVDLFYQGPLEEGINYSFTLTNTISGLQTPLRNVACTTGTSLNYESAYLTGNAGANLCLPGYDLNTSAASNPYTATLTISKAYPNGNGNCNYSYSFSKQIWTTTSDLKVEVVGNYNMNGNIYEICENEPLILAGNVSGTINWFVDLNSVSVFEGSNFHPTLVGVHDYYYTKSSGSCIGSSNHVLVKIKSNPPAFITSNCDASTTNVTLTGSSGSEYTWNDGSITNSIAVGNAEKYSVRITQVDGCYRIAKTSVLSKPVISFTGNACNGGIATLSETSIDNSGGNYSFQWYRFDAVSNTWLLLIPTTQIIQVNQFGLYRVVISINGKCRASTAVSHGYYISAATVVEPNCSNSNSGQINITITPSPSTQYTFLWSNGATTKNLVNVSSGTYTLTITRTIDNCVQSSTFTLNSSLTVNTSKTDALCHGDFSGTATASPTGGTMPYLYSWNSIPVQTTSIATGLRAGNYIVIVTDNNGCTGSGTVIITEPSLLQTYISSVNPLCDGDLNGTATANSFGGNSTIAYTYLWSTGAVSQSITTLGAGSYQVEVTDANGCTTLASIVLSNPLPVSASFNSNSVCQGSNLIINFSGTPPWTLIYSDGTSHTINSSTNFYELNAPPNGTYTLISIADGNNCSLSLSDQATVYPIVTANVTIAANTGNSICLGTSVTFTATSTSGIPTPSYQWEKDGLIVGANNAVYTDPSITDGNVIKCVLSSSESCVIGSPVTSNIITMIVSPNPTIISLANTNITCYGLHNGTATVSASGSGTLTYQWSCSSQTSSSVTGIYPSMGCTVNITDGNNCSTTSSPFNITEPAVLMVAAMNSNNICIGYRNSFAIATPTGGTPAYAYSWNTVPIQTTAQASNLLNGFYTVTVTDNNACTATKSVTVTTSGICCGNFSNYFPQVISNSTVLNGLNYSSNLNPLYHHEVNVSCTLIGNEIEMQEGMDIIVHAGVTLTLTNCTLRACGKMWKGIKLEDGANLILNNTYIYDSENAVRVVANSNLQSNLSHFINNNIGIYYDEFISHSGLFVINQSEFKGTGSMVAPYHGQTTVLGNKPMAGIILNNCNITLGSSGLPNTFENMNSGFVVLDCNTYISNAKFIDITPDISLPANNFNGCGVFADDPYSNGTNFQMEGYGYPNTNLNFAGCQTGIRVEQMNASIINCNMGSSSGNVMETGIQYMWGNYLTCKIVLNSIDAIRYGINIEYADGAAEVLIDRNIINIGNTLLSNEITGIRLNNYFGSYVTHGAFPKYNVSNNTINMNNYVDNGIGLNGVNNYFIKGNYINLNDNLLQTRGVSMIGCSQNEVSCNRIISSDHSFTVNNQAGIYAEKASDNKVQCNHVDYTTNGLYFELDCPNSEIFGNTISNHDVGLEVGVLGIIGQQPLNYPLGKLPGNIWNGTCNSWGAENKNGNINRYYFNDYYPYSQFTAQSSTPPNWFSPSSFRNFECGPVNLDGTYLVPGYCGSLKPDELIGSNETNLDLKIAQDSIQFTAYNEEMLWSLKKYLFEKLKFNEELLYNDSAFILFYDSMLTTSLAVFGEVKEKEINYFNPDSIILNDVESKKSLIQTNLELMKSNQEQLANSGLSDLEVQNLKLEIDAFQVNIGTLKSSIELILSQYNSGKLIFANLAKSEVQGISTSELIELNLKQVKEIYLNTVAQRRSNFTQNELNLLAQIAFQCPVSGGEAVYLARGLYGLKYPNIRYDDHLTCLQQGIFYRQSHDNSTQSIFKLYPNPTSNSFTFNYSAIGTKSFLYVYNQLGGIVKMIKLDENKNQIGIDVTEILNGVYHVELIQDDISIYKDMLVIVK